jgi:hypothetical protein
VSKQHHGTAPLRLAPRSLPGESAGALSRAAPPPAGILGLKLQPVAKQLVANALPLATHNRYRVRVAAVQAVRATMFQNAHEMILEMVAFRDPNVVAIKVRMA